MGILDLLLIRTDDRCVLIVRDTRWDSPPWETYSRYEKIGGEK